MVIRGRTSLRRRALSRVGQRDPRWRRLLQALGRNVWALMARPWGIPTLATTAVIVLAVWRPDIPDRSFLCSTLEVLCLDESSRQLLSVIWQVEGAALALTVAATLFAFESAVRQRSSLGLHDYAERAWLMQFVMLGASGLIVVGLVLAWEAGRPPVAAAALALTVAGAGIAAFPFFLRRAMDVVGPAWFRRQRLGDIRRAVETHIRSEAIELASLIELDEWLATRENCRRAQWAIQPHVPLEVSPQHATVFDVDLRRLAAWIEGGATNVFIAVHPGSRIGAESTMIGAATVEASPSERHAVTLVASSSEDLLPSIVNALHEEGLEAVRSGSPSAAEEVAEGYVEMLLSWPRTWDELGQQVRGGLLNALYPFHVGPLDEVQRHLWLQLEQAIDRGLREHVLTITSIPWAVAREAIPLRADDLVRKLNQLARMFVSASKGTTDLARLVADRAWRYHVEVCEFHAARRLEEAEDPAEQEYWASVVALYYAGIADLLRDFWVRGFDEDFEALDGRYRKILQFWDPAGDHHLAEAIIEDPDRYGATQSDVEEARRALASRELKVRLNRRRAGYRLSVLAWMIHRAATDDEAAWRRIRAYAEALPGPEELVASAEHALDHDGLLERWVSLDGPELEVRSIDVEGPALRALLVTLILRRSALKWIPPAPWMSEHRMKRARGLVRELLALPHVRGYALDPNEPLEAAENRMIALLQQAEDEQRAIEDRELIARDLDVTKVAAFKDAVVRGWAENRLAPHLLNLVGEHIKLVDAADFGEARFGFVPQLEPKGMFVTPTNWDGVDSHGEHLGSELARGEASEVIRAAVEHARPVRGKGTGQERLSMLLDRLEADGHTPDMILMPINWRLGRQLGLSEWRDHQSIEGPLGHHVRGWIDGIPVVEWSAVDKDRLYALDVAAFCDVEEARVHDSEGPEPPQVVLEPIDEARAVEIIAQWDELENDMEEASRLRRVLKSVRVVINRPYRVVVRDKAAVRSVWLPPSARGE